MRFGGSIPVKEKSEENDGLQDHPFSEVFLVLTN